MWASWACRSTSPSRTSLRWVPHCLPDCSRIGSDQIMSSSSRHGGPACLPAPFTASCALCCQAELETHDGVSAGKYTIGLGQDSLAFCSDQEDVISMRCAVGWMRAGDNEKEPSAHCSFVFVSVSLWFNNCWRSTRLIQSWWEGWRLDLRRLSTRASPSNQR